MAGLKKGKKTPKDMPNVTITAEPAILGSGMARSAAEKIKARKKKMKDMLDQI